MIKILYGFKKKAELSHSEFAIYLTQKHAHIGAMIPGLKKFVQNISLDYQEPSDFDAVAELWFADRDSLEKARNSEQWQTSTEDEKNFLDEKSTFYFVGREHIVK